MPLMPGKSKKAFSENVATEMKHGKPQPQALAIAYSVKRKNGKKKMAEGGMVNESAKSEHRPMPDERDKDSAEVSRNSGKKASSEDSWTDQPTVKQAQKPSLTRLSRPRMVGSDAFSVRTREEVDADMDRMDSMPPESPEAQPPKKYDEEDAAKSGPKVPDMQDEHSNHRKPYAKGGMINEEVSIKDADEDHAEHPAGLESDDDEMSPPEKEFMAGHFAEGGEVSPEDEEMEEHHSSITAAIMAKRDRMKAMIDSGAMDEDHAVHGYAEGGEVNGHDSIYAHPEEDQADLSRNAEEDANMEDQSSFDALRKENYSESAGLDALDNPHNSSLHGAPREDDEENKHDMISAIRSKMNMRRQFKQR